MNDRRIAALLRDNANELERDEQRAGKPNLPKAPRRKPVRKPYVSTRKFTEAELEAARQRARRFGFPLR